jgi:transposase-like protein
MPEIERLLDSDCPYCLLRREIIAVRFSFFKPCTALFVCPSCGSTFADIDGPSRKRGRSLHLKAYLFLRWKRARTVRLAYKNLAPITRRARTSASRGPKK